MNIFNAPEIIDIGIEKEKKRRDFYGRVAEAFEDKDMKELFTRLRDWEEAHIKRFSEIRKGAKDSEATESYPGESKAYTDALLDDTLYKEVSPSEFSHKVKTPLSAVQYGINFEKDAILFFNEFLSVALPQDRDAVRQLLNEEKQHLIYLTRLKEKAKNAR